MSNTLHTEDSVTQYNVAKPYQVQGDSAVEYEVLTIASKTWCAVVRHWDDVTAIVGLVFIVRWIWVK
jgi:hypothetical protein